MTAQHDQCARRWLRLVAALQAIREGLRLGRRFVLIAETDPAHGGAPSFQQYMSEAPEDVQPVFWSATAVPWHRDAEYQPARKLPFPLEKLAGRNPALG